MKSRKSGVLLVALALLATGCRGGGEADGESAVSAPGVSDEACPDAVNTDNGCIYLGVLSEKVGGVKVQLVNGSHGEQITGDKKQTYAAAELHMTKGGIATQAGGSVTNMVGGLHYQNLAGDYVVKATNITLLGAVGVFKGGGSEIKLGGGPVVIKGGKVAVKGTLIVKLGASMKLGG